MIMRMKTTYQKNNFAEYWSSFDSNGYDDLKQLQEMLIDDIEEVPRDDIGIHKRGHRKRLQALLTIQSVQKKNRADNAAQRVSVSSTRMFHFFIIDVIELYYRFDYNICVQF